MKEEPSIMTPNLTARTILSALLCVVIMSAFAQTKTGTDYWQEDTKTYVSPTYGFYWRLNEDVEWEVIPKEYMLQEGAVFAARGDDGLVVAYIVDAGDVNDGIDIWETEEVFRTGISSAYGSMGNNVRLESLEKCTLDGFHAFKIRQTYSLAGDDRYPDAGELTYLSYALAKEGKLLHFFLLYPKELEDYLNQVGVTIEYTFFAHLRLNISKETLRSK